MLYPHFGACSWGRVPALLMLCGCLLAAADGGADPDPQQDPLFQDLPVVEAASLRMQTLKEAPANVTIISAADITKYGYRTLGEALSSVRGFYATTDRIYEYVGVRGINLPGDFNRKFLVMINGHNMTEHLFNSNGFFGEDFGLDMDLVARIEIVRGPSSALYGSNGMLATINIVTKSPVDMKKARVAADLGSFGERKLMASTTQYLGKGANLLVSASVFNNGGQDLYSPAFDSPATNNGWANGVDGERGYHTFANLVWRDWNFTAYFTSREKQPPVAWGPSVIFDDPGNDTRDSRNFINASYSKTFGDDSKLHWQIYYDDYNYHERFDYPLGDQVQDVRYTALNNWVGTDLNYQFNASRFGALTLGTQLRYGLRNLQHNYVISPVFEEGVTVDRPGQSVALFIQDELPLTRNLKAYLGARLDGSKGLDWSISPRVALVYQTSPNTSYKAVYGHPYREPSVGEQYYSAPDQLLAGPLRNETANTFDVSVEHKFRRNLEGVIAAYDYGFQNIIQATAAQDSPLQYQNAGSSRSRGVEFELSGKPGSSIEAAVSYSYGLAKDVMLNQVLPNSPQHIGKLRMAIPLARGKLWLSESTQFMSARADQNGDFLKSVILQDLTLTTNNVSKDYDLQFGVRNLANTSYDNPTAVAIAHMPGNGISVFTRIILHTRD